MVGIFLTLLGPVKLMDPKDAFERGDDVLKKPIYDLVNYSNMKWDNGVERWSQSQYVDWSQIISNETLLVECGLSRASLDNIVSRIPIDNGPYDLTWGPHREKHRENEEEKYYLKANLPTLLKRG